MLYQSALLHVLDTIFALLCSDGDDRTSKLAANLERIERMLEPKP
jgi:hypothetical protein